jgi:cyclophilin family peptidyl-prolyl cis-trans isomerase
MSVCTRLALVWWVMWMAGWAVAAEQAATGPEPAAAEASQPETPEAKEPAEEPALGPKNRRFNELFSPWKAILAEIRQLQTEYQAADAERKTEIKTRFAELVEQGEALQPQLIEAAREAYLEDAKAGETAGKFLFDAVVYESRRENYEQVLPPAEALIEGGFADKSVFAWAGLAALVTSQLDAAEKYFTAADENDAFKALRALDPDYQLSDLAGSYRELLAYYRKAWPKEQEIRAREAEADDLPRVLLVTNKGEIELELFENEAPDTVANFISLVEKGFYDGLTFHRVLPGFMAQGGCPDGTGSGGPGYKIPCECYEPDRRLHFRGTLSMAHAGRDTGGSQFFLTFTPTKHLDGRHTAFGRVVRGMEVLAKIQRRNPQSPNPPKADKILEAKVLRKRDHEYMPKKVGE